MLNRTVVMLAIVATTSLWSPSLTPAAESVAVTVQELMQRDHRLAVSAGTEVLWRDPHFERVWFPTDGNMPKVQRADVGFRAVFSTPGTYRGRFTIVGGHRSNDVYPLVVTVTER